MEKIKIGFVGLGDHALQSHLALMLKYDDVEIVGAFDPNPDSFARVEEEYGINLQSFENYIELLQAVDGVVIASPDRFHTHQLMQAVCEGKHVLCEKPLCAGLDALVILKTCFNTAQEKNLVITSCHPRRYDLPYLWVKNNLDDLIAKYGNVVGIELDFSYHKPSADKAHLHGDSMLQDHANHEIDYVNFLFGVKVMSAYKLLDVFDRYEIAGVREDGITFHFKGTRRLDARHFGETIEIRFERACLHIDTKDSSKSYIDDNETQERLPVDSQETSYEIRFDGINRNFIDCIKGVAENYLSANDMMLNSRMSVVFKTQNKFEFYM